MTLAGTRPPTVDEWDKYELHHRARLATKPGLTGMWQVSGRSNITDFEEVVKLDKQYISEKALLYTDILGRYCAEDVIGDDCLLHYRKYVKDKTATSGLCILYMQHEENTVFYHANPYFDVETILKSDDDDFKNRVSLPF